MAPPLNLADEMLVYRTDERGVDAREALNHLIARIESLERPTHDQVISVFIELGEFESAIADRCFPKEDGIDALTEALRTAALASGHAVIASWRGELDGRDRAVARLQHSVRALQPSQLPATVSRRASEGYAYYALRPEAYAAAAEQWMREQRSTSAVCVGIRSIGCSLSAVVAAAVERRGVRIATYTVRPRGHPFDRHVVFDNRLIARLRTAPADAHFLVVDEGPGLSGSSFASVAQALRRMGIAADRIALFPSSNPDGSNFRSASARRVWNEHRRYWIGDREAGCQLSDVADDGDGVDVSAGKWRQVFWKESVAAPAVHPQHEVMKRWFPELSTIVRFAGLGRYGDAKLQRSQLLADAGLGPAPLELKGGYLWLPFLNASGWGTSSEALVDAVAVHCGFLTRSCSASRSPSIDSLFDMIATNIREGCGGDVVVPDLEQYRAALENAPCAAIDGRMLPHEWLHTNGRYIKVDALDHHQDHFFPGTQDAGWDLAAAAFEFDLDRFARARLVEQYVTESHDADVARRMPFYDVAYPAFRLGYAMMAAESLVDPVEARRFRDIAARCRWRLAHVTRHPVQRL